MHFAVAGHGSRGPHVSSRLLCLPDGPDILLVCRSAPYSWCSRVCVHVRLQAGRWCQDLVACAGLLRIMMVRALKCWTCAALPLRPATLTCCIVSARVLCDPPSVPSRLQDKASACSDVGFPCVGACTQDFAQPCPAGWTLDGSGSCVAPATYSGQCPATKSFANLGLRPCGHACSCACRLSVQCVVTLAGIADRSAWASFCAVEAPRFSGSSLLSTALRLASICRCVAVALPPDPLSTGANGLRAELCGFLPGGVSSWARSFLLVS